MSRVLPGSVRRAAIRRDLGRDRVASTAMVLAVALAIAVVGTFVGSGAMVRSDLAAAHLASRPADVIVETDGPVPIDVLERIRALDGIEDAAVDVVRASRVRLARPGAAWQDFELTVVDEIGSEAVERSVPVDGARPGPGEILVDRTSQDLLGAGVGDVLHVQRADGSAVTVRIAGRSARAGRAAWFDPPAFGITTWRAIEGLGLDDGRARLLLRTTSAVGLPMSVVADVQARLHQAGLGAGRVEVVGSSDRPAVARTLETIDIVLATLGVLGLVAAGLLVANEAGTIVTAHRRRIGVLRAIGADGAQVAAWYGAHIAILTGIGTALGLVLGAIGARGMSTYVAGLINVDPAAILPPPWVIVLELGMGAAIAVLGATGPIRRALHGPVRAAIDDRGIGTQRQFPIPSGPPRAVRAMAVRNLLRRPRRSVLALASLAVSGAMVIGTVDAQAGIGRAHEAAAWFRADDVAVDVPADGGQAGAMLARLDRALARTRATPGVRAAETWRLDIARVEGPFLAASGDLDPGPPTGPPLFGVSVLGVPPQTTMLRPTLLAGRWLDDVPDGAVVSPAFLATTPGAEVGGSLRLVLGDRRVEVVIRGVLAEPAAERLVIVPRDTLAAAPASPVARLRLVVAGDGSVAEPTLVASISALLSSEALTVEGIETRAGRVATMEADARGSAILASFMLGSAAVVGAIGSIGLVGLLASNVADRRRELAVLRALGAAPGRIVRLLLAEAIALTAASAVLAMALAVPLAALLATLLGEAFLDRPLAADPGWGQRAAWLAVAVGAALLATIVPARRVANLVLRDELAYE